jgi:hypothetical protein
MRYIQRNERGEVVGHFAHPHPYAQEAVADDHPDILAWAARIQASKADYMRVKAVANPEALLARVAALEAEVKDLKK